jgi:hypothetical protein
MTTIKHSLEFITELDEKHPSVQQLLALPEEMRLQLLNEILKSSLAPKIQPILDELNLNGSYAILKVA